MKVNTTKNLKGFDILGCAFLEHFISNWTCGSAICNKSYLKGILDELLNELKC